MRRTNNHTAVQEQRTSNSRPMSSYDNLDTPDENSYKNESSTPAPDTPSVNVVSGSKEFKNSSLLNKNNINRPHKTGNNSTFEVSNGKYNNSNKSMMTQATLPSPPPPVIFSSQSTTTTSDDAISTQNNVVGSKPVISDAKSKFFGINNSPPKTLVEYNNEKGVRLTTISIGTTAIQDNSNLLTTDSKLVTIVPSNQHQIPEKNQVVLKDCCSEADIHHNHHHHQQPHNTSSGSKSTNFKHNSMHDMDISNPSQLVYMTTTVPQNMKGNDIAGRHTPTRNSLRHSRMLVINKNFQGPKSPNPLGLRYPYLTKVCLIHHIVFGVLLTCVGFWILLWAPNTRLQDNPYWSGITLTLAGILGLIVTRFKRIKRYKIRENCFIFLKYDSYVLTLLASVLCLIALICAAVHLHNLNSSTTKCTSTNILIANAACTCAFGVIESSNSSNSTEIVRSDYSHEFYYRDLSCNEVFGAWKFILTVSVLCNALGFCVTVLYILSVFWRKDSKNMYTSVRTNIL